MCSVSNLSYHRKHFSHSNALSSSLTINIYVDFQQHSSISRDVEGGICFFVVLARLYVEFKNLGQITS